MTEYKETISHYRDFVAGVVGSIAMLWAVAGSVDGSGDFDRKVVMVCVAIVVVCVVISTDWLKASAIIVGVLAALSWFAAAFSQGHQGWIIAAVSTALEIFLIKMAVKIRSN